MATFDEKILNMVSATRRPAGARRAPEASRKDPQIPEAILTSLRKMSDLMAPSVKLGAQAFERGIVSMTVEQRRDLIAFTTSAVLTQAELEAALKAHDVVEPETSGDAELSPYQVYKQRLGRFLLKNGPDAIDHITGKTTTELRDVARGAMFDYLCSLHPASSVATPATSMYINRSGESVSKGTAQHRLTLGNIYTRMYFHEAPQVTISFDTVKAYLEVLNLQVTNLPEESLSIPRGGIARAARFDQNPLGQLIALVVYRVSRATDEAANTVAYFHDPQAFDIKVLPMILRGFCGHTGKAAPTKRAPRALATYFTEREGAEAPTLDPSAALDRVRPKSDAAAAAAESPAEQAYAKWAAMGVATGKLPGLAKKVDGFTVVYEDKTGFVAGTDGKRYAHGSKNAIGFRA